MLETQLVT